MSETGPTIVINDAPRQVDRVRPPLAPGFAPVDGRGFADLTEFATRVAGLIRYWSLEDVEDGTWEAFFQESPVPVLATLAASGRGRLGAALAALRRPDDGVQPARRLTRAFGLLHRVGRAWALWPRLAASLPAGAVARPARSTVESLGRDAIAPALRRLAALERGAAGLGIGAGLDWSGFPEGWGLAATAPDTAAFRGRDEAQRVAAGFEALGPVAAALGEAADRLGSDTEDALQAVIRATAQPPHLALHMAFDRLYATAQDTMNRFGRRLVDFYYRDMLRETERGPRPDQLFLTVTLAEGVQRASLPKGTRAVAGADANGRDILYRTTRTLDATAAAVAALRTLRTVHRNPFGGDLPPVACECYAAEVPLPGEDGPPPPWPLFGRAPGDPWPWTPAPVPVPANLGFAVASPALWLAGGTREVTLTITWSAAWWSGTLEPRLKAIAAATGGTEGAILARLWTSMLRLALTTADGWLDVAHTAAAVPSRADLVPAPIAGVTLTVPLGEMAPAIAPLPPPPEDGPAPIDPEPGVPALAAWLATRPVPIEGPRGTAAVPPLAIIDGLRPERLELSVAVKDRAVDTLANTDGELDPTAPFNVFGGLPVVGSRLELRCRELFVKTLHRLDLAIGWFNIPASATGFKGYYTGYVLGPEGGPPLVPYDNAVFRNAITTTGNGSWKLGEPKDGDCFLFRSKDFPDGPPESDKPLDPATVFKDLPVAERHADPFFDPDAAALRVTLTGPLNAFGNDIYARNVLKAVIDSLPKPPPTAAEAAAAAENAALQDLAEFVHDALQSCAGEPADAYRAAVSKALDSVVDYLVLTASQGLVAAYETATAAGRLSDAARTTLRDHAKAVGAAEGRARVDRLGEWLTDAVLLTGDVAAPALRRSKAVIEALKALVERSDDCARQQGELYRNCMEVSLERCHEYLEQAYQDCIAVTVRHAAETPSEDKPVVYPNEPWLPQATAVTVGYGARSAVVGEGAGQYGAGRLYHLGPFGGSAPAAPADGPVLVAVPADEGILLIGLDGAAPPQPLDLLVRLAAASGRGDPKPVTWAVASGDGWRPLDGEALRLDGTRGMACTGIVALSLSAATPADAGVRPGAGLWLRVSAALGADRFPPGVTITANAVTARWDPEGGGAAGLGKPLPAGSITALAEPRADVEGLEQPLESTGGSAPETPGRMEIRVGERLRHKARAIQPWDYERLTLERFPMVWQVKAMPARAADGSVSAGSVLVAVVPGPDAPGKPDPLIPAADGTLLERVRAHLAAAASPFLHIRAVNPVYVRVRVTARLTLVEDADSGAVLAALNADLCAFLSPWYAGGNPAGRFTQAAVATFLRGRPSVLSVLSVALAEEPPGRTLPWCLLTSAERHAIEMVAPAGGGDRSTSRSALKWRRLADDDA